MPRCRDINHLASEYVDGMLPLRTRLGFMLHLLICGHCRRFLRQFRLLLTSLGRRPVSSPNADFVDRVISALETDDFRGGPDIQG